MYDKIGRDTTTVDTMTLLASILHTRVFLTGDGNRLGAVDIIVAGGLYDLLTLVFPASTVASDSPFAPVSRWFATVVAQPAFEATVRRLGVSTGGFVRVGSQVDLRASPVAVAALADASIAKNASYKKSASQRDVSARERARTRVRSGRAPVLRVCGA